MAPSGGNVAQVQEALVAGQQADVVVDADPLGELAAPAAIEAEEDRVDRRVDEEDGHQEPGRTEEQQGRSIVPPPRRLRDRRLEGRLDHGIERTSG